MKESLIDLTTVEDSNIRLYVASGQANQNWLRSRMLLMDSEKEIGSHNVNAKIISVASHPTKFEVMALSRTGEVSVADSSGVRFEFIDDSDNVGVLRRVRYLGTTPLICGDMRQLYRRTSGGWERIDRGLRVDDSKSVGCALNDLAGSSVDQAYAFGDRGVIFRWVGGQWEACDSPINVNLESAIFSSNGSIWACGASGTVIRGIGNAWQVLPAEEFTKDVLWAITEFEGDIFVCSNTAVYRIDEVSAEQVNVPEFDGEFFRLASDQDFLWVLGFDDLMRFDGNSWKHIPWRTGD